MRGKIIEIRTNLTDRQLVIRLDNGTLRKRRLDVNCIISLNNKESQYSELRPGDIVEFEGQPIVKVAAVR